MDFTILELQKLVEGLNLIKEKGGSVDEIGWGKFENESECVDFDTNLDIFVVVNK